MCHRSHLSFNRCYLVWVFDAVRVMEIIAVMEDTTDEQLVSFAKANLNLESV